MTTRIIGIDPDTNNTGIAMVTVHDRTVTGCGFLAAHAEGPTAAMRLGAMSDALLAHLASQHADIVVIERQHIRPRDPRPNDIMALQAVFGAAAGLAVAFVRPCMDKVRLLTPVPSDWKGSVPKAKHQPRILRAIPDWLRNAHAALPNNIRSHCLDALGLALWAAGIKV